MSAIPFTRLARVEAAKLADTRSARWLLGLAVVAVVAVLLVMALVDGAERTPKAMAQAAEAAAALLLVLATILLVTTEWTQRTVLVTFVQEPRRLRVLAAKAVACAALAVAVALLCSGLAYAALALGAAAGRDVAWSPAAPVAGLAGELLLEVLAGLAIGALVQQSAGAIVAYFLAPVAVAALTTIPALEGASRWLDRGAFIRLRDGTAGGHWAEIATAAAFWIALPLALGAVRTLRRDVT